MTRSWRAATRGGAARDPLWQHGAQREARGGEAAERELQSSRVLHGSSRRPHRVRSAHRPAEFRVRSDAADAFTQEDPVEDVFNHWPSDDVRDGRENGLWRSERSGRREGRVEEGNNGGFGGDA